jgi:hypothetical protein
MSKEPEDRKDELEPKDGEHAEDEAPEDEHVSDEESDEEGDDAADAAKDEDDAQADDEGSGSDEPAKAKTGAAKPAPKAKSGVKANGAAKKKSAKPRPSSGRAALPPKRSRIPNILLYALLIGGIALAFAFLGQQDGGGGDEPPQPKWKDGDVVDVTITLVTTDWKDLACSSDEVLKDKHCGFDDKRKPHPKGNDVRTDPNVLQPYTTTDRIQLLAAGMWTTPELKAKLDAEKWDNPSPRFNVDCKLKVEGHMKEAGVRWKPEPDGGWLSGPAKDWYAGSLSDCKIRATHNLPPKAKP